MARPSRTDPHRPCENPQCGAVDSTHCKFRIGVTSGMVVPSQMQEAKEVGCRVARFEKNEKKRETDNASE